MKSKLAAFTDTLFLRLLLFAGCFLWAGFYVAPYPAAFAAFAAAVSVTGLMTRRKRTAPPAEAAFMDATLLQLTLLPKEQATDLVFAALSKRFHPERTDAGVLVNGRFVYPAFSPEPLSAETLAAAAGAHDRVIVLTVNGLSPAADKLYARLSDRVSVKEGDDVYRMLKKTATFPKMRVCSPAKPRRGAALMAAFSRDKTRKYLISSALLFAGAYLLPYGVYYLVVASACLAAAALCLLPKRKRAR